MFHKKKRTRSTQKEVQEAMAIRDEKLADANEAVHLVDDLVEDLLLEQYEEAELRRFD